jgi:hypothetical protein
MTTQRFIILYSFVFGDILGVVLNITEPDHSLVALGKELILIALLGLVSRKYQIEVVAYQH